MKIAYLILVHGNPAHLQRLIQALSSESCSIFVHIDKKSDLSDFSDIKVGNVLVSEKRIPVHIAHFSQVEATLLLIKQALNNPLIFDRFVLLSGADYPLHSSSFIQQFFEQNQKMEFIDCVELPNPAWNQRIDRYTRFRSSPSTPALFQSVRRRLRNLGFIPTQRNYQKYLGSLVPCVGATWWALSREACQFIVKFTKDQPRVVNFYKNMCNPDEAFFQTVLNNSNFKEMIRPSLTYVDWREGNPHPAMIGDEHLTLLSEPNLDHFYTTAINYSDIFLFARKFSDNSTAIIDALDKLIIEHEGS